MDAARVVWITHPVEGAEAFARGLLERRLAACVNLTRVTSVYRWQERIHEDAEALLVVKTSALRLAELARHVAREHPYETPEFVALEPAAVEPRYLAWLLGEVS